MLQAPRRSTPRRPDRKLIFEVQTTAERAMREVWANEHFIELHSPKLMGSASESGAELFKAEYFDRTAYLAQSPQFYKQMAIAAGVDRVFEVGPVFRADAALFLIRTVNELGVLQASRPLHNHCCARAATRSSIPAGCH